MVGENYTGMGGWMGKLCSQHDIGFIEEGGARHQPSAGQIRKAIHAILWAIKVSHCSVVLLFVFSGT